MFDIIIIGGGPAGLTAAVYARRADKSVLVLEKATFGGQITYSPQVENIPGFVSVSGNEFAEALVGQVLEQGAEVDAAEVLSVREADGVFTVVTDSGEHQARAVIVATGARHRMLGLDGEEGYVGNGISFCAVCDGAFYRDRTVAVIGGGNSALQEALLLADVAKRVVIVQNLPTLTGEAKLQAQVAARDNIEVITDATVTALHGDELLDGITITRTDGTLQRLALDGMFVAIGLVPQNEPFADILPLDERGYADADEHCVTPRAGVFVAGDCRKKRIRQVATAAADGAIAALTACEYLDG